MLLALVPEKVPRIEIHEWCCSSMNFGCVELLRDIHTSLKQPLMQPLIMAKETLLAPVQCFFLLFHPQKIDPSRKKFLGTQE